MTTNPWTVLFPVQCAVCGKGIDAGNICDECRRDIPRAFRTDLQYHPVAVQIRRRVKDCRIFSALPYFHAVDGYEGKSYARLVHLLKSGHYKGVAPELADIVIDEANRDGVNFLSETDFLIYVPAHWTRLLTRTYNQSAELAKCIGSILNIPAINALSTSYHAPQKGLQRMQRIFSSQQNRFKSRFIPELQGATVTLVDDVLTTGSTLLACANALLDANPDIRALHIITVARTLEG